MADDDSNREGRPKPSTPQPPTSQSGYGHQSDGATAQEGRRQQRDEQHSKVERRDTPPTSPRKNRSQKPA